jgi:excisionase family DNA binding protein
MICDDIVMGRAKVYKLAEIQTELGVSRWTLYDWLRRGKLQAFKLPCGHYRVPEAEMSKLRGQVTVNGQGSDK